MKIDALWSEISKGKELPAFRRINETHPLDIYLGIDEQSRPLLLLVSDQLAPDTGTFQSISVQRLRRDDGLWSYTFTLEALQLAPLFGLLCEDLVVSTEPLPLEQGTLMFFARLKRWKALLATGSLGLSEQEARGLLAELYVLLEVLGPVFGIEVSAQGWSGPEAEEQDFRVSNRAFEVKSLSVGKTRIQIASLRQLDFISGPLDLLVVPVSPTSSDRGVSLATMVGLIRERLAGHVQALAGFEANLVLAGYGDEDTATERPYLISAPTRYEVGDGFPTLTPSSVPLGVVEISYTIDLALCRSFERSLPL
jgi:hypothetical protein